MSDVQYGNAETKIATGSSREQEIKAWLVKRLARELEISPHEIDLKVPFNRYGLDSLAAVHLVSSLEEWMGSELSPTLPYDYPTVESLARHLSGVAE
jgi:acyl carrier protein